MSEVHDREREARQAIWATMRRWHTLRHTDDDCGTTAALDAYRDAVERRVRWDQQADAEGYDIPGGPR